MMVAERRTEIKADMMLLLVTLCWGVSYYGMLADEADEKMLASYSYREMERLLSDHKFLIYEHLTPEKMSEQYFAAYNKVNPVHPITAFDNADYCLAVRS